MATETLTIPLGNGKLAGSKFYAGNENDTQYVTLSDGGNLSNITLAKFGKGTATESGEGAGGDDEFYMDLSGFNDDFNVGIASMDAGDTFFITSALAWSNVGNIYTINYIGSDGAAHVLTIDLESTNGTGSAGIYITCFVTGTMIETSAGQIAVETLEVGDHVLCGDGGLRPIRWIAERHVSCKELKQHPEFTPIRIRKNALGNDTPFADLYVSPQHRILLGGWRAELLFGTPEVLVSALHMIDDNKITRDFTAREVTYYHFMFDDHQTVLSNGLGSESFFPGDVALDAVEDDARAELFQLFPALETHQGPSATTCHQTLRHHEACLMQQLCA